MSRIQFVFGMDAHPNLVMLAEALLREAWSPLEQLPAQDCDTARRKPERVKESIVVSRAMRTSAWKAKILPTSNISPANARGPIGWSSCARTSAWKKARESSSMRFVTFSISPTAPICPGANRQSGQWALQSRERDRAAQKWSQRHAHAGGRFAEQLGLYGDDLLGLESEGVVRLALARCSTRSGVDQDGVSALLHAIVLLPAQIVRTGRRVIYRIMSYNRWLKDLFAVWEHLRRLRCHLAKKTNQIHPTTCVHMRRTMPRYCDNRPSARRQMPQFAFKPTFELLMLRHRAARRPKSPANTSKKCDPRDPGALRVGFSLFFCLD